MPRNTSGTYLLPTGNPVAANTVIKSDWANSTLNDVAQALTESLDRYGRSTMQAEFYAIDGTNLKPGLSFGQETTSGLFRKGTQVLGISVGTTEVATLTPTGVSFPKGITGTLSLTGPVSITGPLTITGAMGITGVLSLADGTAPLPSLAFTSDPNTGLYWVSADAFGFSAGGVLRATLDGSGFNMAGGRIVRGSGSTSGTWQIGPNNSTGNLEVQVAAVAAVNANMDFNALVADGTSAASVRLFRATNTTGLRSFQILRGDNTGTVDHHFLSGNAGVLAKLAQNGGRTLIGTTTDNATDTLQVGGTTRVRTGASGTGGNASYNDFVTELSTSGGMSILSPAAAAVGLMFCRPSFPSAGGLLYDHATDTLTLQAASAARVSFSSAVLTSSLLLRLPDGTAAAPALNFSNNNDLGLYRPGASILGFVTGGVEKMRVTASPDAQLLVGSTGAALFGGAGRGLIEINGSNNSLLALNSAGVQAGYLVATSAAMTISTVGARVLTFNTASSECARFTSAAQAELLIGTQATGGLGTTSRGLVFVSGAATAAVGVGVAGVPAGNLYTDGSGMSVNAVAASPLLFTIGGVEAARVASDLTLQYAGKEVGWRDLNTDQASIATYIITAANRGRCVVLNSACTNVRVDALTAGSIVNVYNNNGNGGASVTLTAGAGVGFKWGTGTPVVTSPRTLALGGMVSLFYISGTSVLITGTGIS